MRQGHIIKENIKFWPKITEIMIAICVLFKIIGLIQHTVFSVVLKCLSVRYKYRLPLNRMIPAPSFHYLCSQNVPIYLTAFSQFLKDKSSSKWASEGPSEMITPFQNGYYSMNVLLRSQSREFLTINTLRTKLGRFSDPISFLSVFASTLYDLPQT